MMQGDLTDSQYSLSRNFSILVFRDFLGKIIAFLGQIVLARILFPQQFGTFAIMAFVLNFFLLFSDIGLSPLIIQKKDAVNNKTLGTIFTIKILLNLSLVVILNLLVPLLPVIYHSFTSKSVFMMRILSWDILLIAFQSMPIALSEKSMNYKRISFVNVVGMIIYYVTAITCAVNGFQIWSFIFATLLKDSGELILISVFTRWVPLFAFDKKIIKEIMNFGIYMQGTGIVTFFSNAIIPLVAGIQSGVTAVGLLDWATNVVGVPESITNNFGRVAFAKFSKIQENRTLLSELIEKSLKSLTTISFLLILLLLSYGREATEVFYTNKWANGIPALYWLAASMLFYPLIATFGQALLAVKKSKEVFYITCFTTTINWILALILIEKFNFTGIAIASFFSTGLLSILYIIRARIHNFHVNAVRVTLIRLAVLCFVLAISLIWNNYFPENNFFTLVYKTIGTCLLYAICSFHIAKKDFLELLGKVSIFSL